MKTGIKTCLILLLACLTLPMSASAQGAACDRFETLVATTPVPEQSAPLLRRYYDLLAQIPPAADVVLVGDSITQGWPPEAIQAAFPGKRVYDFGINADQTQNVLWRLASHQLTGLAPETVMLLIGTNNLGTKAAPCAVIAGIEKTIGQIDALWHKPRLLFVDITPRGRGFTFRDAERRQINEAMNAFVTRRGNARIVNIDGAITCRGQPDCPNYKPDFLHFTPTGYAVYAAAVNSVYSGWNR